MLEARKIFKAMSKEQLQTLLDQLKDNVDLQEKLKGAANLDAAVAIANSMGFVVSKADWLENKRLIGPHLLWEWDWI
ncbi:MAG: Nif11-like leader peptide family natural product precursor [Cyanobium sp. LacPavin_0920_WC12_MAG_62_9]|nr:Nif11-like leader peptide family natural product precursor [Cyanobium sp. LacPavin_0920_WC12_MAG_62_9]